MVLLVGDTRGRLRNLRAVEPDQHVLCKFLSRRRPLDGAVRVRTLLCSLGVRLRMDRPQAKNLAGASEQWCEPFALRKA